jgi:hypothetical protein
MADILRRLWSIGFVTCLIGAAIWLLIDHRTPAQRAADAAKEAALFAEWDQQLIKQIEEECGEISAKTIVMDGADGCVKRVMDDFFKAP